ncbi:MAG: MFS transporter [Deltaproteobacteria bacterium]|nr:MFS transporter [Deltaproteobacteria bacterium]
MTSKTEYRTYPYRWVALFFFACVQGVIALSWVVFSPIVSEAARHYDVTPMMIGLNSIVFMIAFVFLSIPASWVIDRYGTKRGVGFGIVTASVFAVIRAVAGDNYALVLTGSVGLALSQPFIVNAITTFTSRWFPLEERATASGIAILFQYIGIMVAMVVTPLLTIKFGISGMLKIYAVLTVGTVVPFFIFVKERPPTPPAEEMERASMLDGMKSILRNRDMLILVAIFFIGLGGFDCISTWIEQIVAPRGFTIVQAGTLGGVLFLGGVTGCICLVPLSDKFRTRKWFLILCAVAAVPSIAGLAFVTRYDLLLVSGFFLGFFMMSPGPVILQYSAEVSYPIPEAASMGVLMVAGQISGATFIYLADATRAENGAMTPFLIGLILLWGGIVMMGFKLNESPMLQAAKAEGECKYI